MAEAGSKPKLFNRELKLRIISALVMVTIVLLITWIGGYTFALLWSIIGLAVYYEYDRICTEVMPMSVSLVGVVTLVLVMLAYHLGERSQLFSIVATGAFVLACWEFFLKRSAWVAFGFLYAALPFIAMSDMRGESWQGFVLVLLLFGCVWGADILAYFFGRIIGGPKLAPKISPKKTWAGFIGSLLGALGLSYLVAGFFGYGVNAVWFLLIFILAVVSQIGDLVESSLKRKFDIKDSGSIIPGHGGVLDRIDGLIPASVILWLVLMVMQQASAPTNGLGVIFEAAFLVAV